MQRVAVRELLVPVEAVPRARDRELDALVCGRPGGSVEVRQVDLFPAWGLGFGGRRCGLETSKDARPEGLVPRDYVDGFLGWVEAIWVLEDVQHGTHLRLEEGEGGDSDRKPEERDSCRRELVRVYEREDMLSQGECVVRRVVQRTREGRHRGRDSRAQYLRREERKVELVPRRERGTVHRGFLRPVLEGEAASPGVPIPRYPTAHLEATIVQVFSRSAGDGVDDVLPCGEQVRDEVLATRAASDHDDRFGVAEDRRVPVEYRVHRLLGFDPILEPGCGWEAGDTVVAVRDDDVVESVRFLRGRYRIANGDGPPSRCVIANNRCYRGVQLDMLVQVEVHGVVLEVFENRGGWRKQRGTRRERERGVRHDWMR